VDEKSKERPRRDLNRSRFAPYRSLAAGFKSTVKSLRSPRPFVTEAPEAGFEPESFRSLRSLHDGVQIHREVASPLTLFVSTRDSVAVLTV
jgi:hypothetical protein